MPFRRLRAAAIAAAAAALLALVVAAAPAGAARAHHCKSSDLRYRFAPGQPRSFGVFRLRIAGGGCATAHRVAKRWKHRFERRLRAGHVTLPRRVRGFHFVTLPATQAQTYRERGRKGARTIRFEFRVPNG
jgi:hypothetical protein